MEKKRSGKLPRLGLKLLNYRLRQECPESSHSHPEQPLGSQLWLSATLFLNEDEELAPSLRLRLVSFSSLQEYLVEPGLIKTGKQKALGNCHRVKIFTSGKGDSGSRVSMQGFPALLPPPVPPVSSFAWLSALRELL